MKNLVYDYFFSNILMESVKSLYDKVSYERSKKILEDLLKKRDLDTVIQNKLTSIIRGTDVHEFDVFCQRLSNSEFKMISSVYMDIRNTFVSVISNSISDIEDNDMILNISSIVLTLLVAFSEENTKNKTRDLIKECVLFIRSPENNKDESKISLIRFIIKKALGVDNESIIKVTLLGLPLMFS